MSSGLSRFFSLPFWLQVFQTFLQTCQRFPLVVLSLIVFNVIALDDIHNLNLISHHISYKVLLSALCGTLWFTATRLLAESLQWTETRHYQLALPVFLLFCWNISAYQDPLSLNVWAPVVAAGLAISFAAWLFRLSDNTSVWYFNYQLIAAICFAILSAVILCGGLSLILVSLGYLFELKISNQVYSDNWLIGMAFLAPLYFLAHIPKQFDFPANSDCQFPKGVHFILTYLLVPLSLMYMVILYAYFIKILFKWELPHGYLGTMISWFGVIGIITHLAIYPIHDRGSTVVDWFYRHFYQIMIVPSGLLILAISLRISQYGVTEQRYLVVICAIWFAALIVAFLIKRQQFRLQFVTISLALLSLLVSFGPWSIVQLPVNSQFSRLKAILIEQNLLIDGKVQVSQQPDFEIRKSISSIATYLVKHNASDKLRPWIKDKQAFDKEFSCDNQKSCYHYTGQKALNLMGINFVRYWQTESSSSYRQITIKGWNQSNNRRTLNISGYDFLIPVKWLSDRGYPSILLTHDDGQQTKLTLKLANQNQLIVINEFGNPLHFDLMGIVAQFPTSQSNEIEVEQADKLIVTASEQNLQGKLFIEQLKLKSNEVESITGQLLLKIGD